MPVKPTSSSDLQQAKMNIMFLASLGGENGWEGGAHLANSICDACARPAGLDGLKLMSCQKCVSSGNIPTKYCSERCFQAIWPMHKRMFHRNGGPGKLWTAGREEATETEEAWAKRTGKSAPDSST